MGTTKRLLSMTFILLCIFLTGSSNSFGTEVSETDCKIIKQKCESSCRGKYIPIEEKVKITACRAGCEISESECILKIQKSSDYNNNSGYGGY
jgi:hypothetical protein